MKVLVTGGAGYLGSVLVPRLLADGHSVTVLDSFWHDVPSLTTSLCPQLNIVKADVRDLAVLGPLVHEADAVIALAALVGAPACDYQPEEAQSVNEDAIRVLCDLMSKDQLLLFPCTNSGYGVGTSERCTEESPIQPVSLYGRTKVAAERMVLQHPKGVSFRFATLFGPSPRMRLDLMVNDFVYRAVCERRLEIFEGHFRRNFLHVQDAARVFCRALRGPERFISGKVFNCGDSRANMTKLALCEKIKEHVDFELIHNEFAADPDKRDYVVSNAKMEAVGWFPTRSLSSGIKELVRCYRQPFEDPHCSWRNA